MVTRSRSQAHTIFISIKTYAQKANLLLVKMKEKNLLKIQPLPKVLRMQAIRSKQLRNIYIRYIPCRSWTAHQRVGALWCLYIYVHACVPLCMYVCMYVCVWSLVHAYTPLCMHVCDYLAMSVYLYTCICLFVYTYAYAYTYTLHVCIVCIYTYMYMYVLFETYHAPDLSM